MKSPMRLTLILLLVVGLTPADAAAVGSWGPKQHLALSGDASAVAADGTVVAAVWEREVGPATSNNTEIFARTSTDGGATWQATSRLSTTPNLSFDATVAVSGTTIHVAWVDLRANGTPRILYRRSTNAGTTWGPVTRLVYSPTWLLSPELAVSGDRVYLMWANDVDFIAYEYGYSRSLDGGISWTRPKFPFGATTCIGGHDIAASGRKVYAVWEGCGLMTATSDTSGRTWGPTVTIDVEPNLPYDPTISGAGRFVNIAWTAGSVGEIYHSRSTNAGAGYSARKRLSKTNNAASFSVSIAQEGANIHMAWFDEKHQAVDVRSSANRGATWGLLSLPTRDVVRNGSDPPPGLAVGNGTVHVTWTSAKHNRPTYRSGS